MFSDHPVAFAYSYYVQLKNSSNHQPPTEDDANNQVQNQELYIKFLRSYYIHLVIRFLLGILFIVLQHTMLFSIGFDSTFKRSLSTTNNGSQSGNTTIHCENSIASQENLHLKIVSALNIAFLSLISLEMLFLCQRFPIFEGLEHRYKTCVSIFIKALFCLIISLLVILFIIPDILQK